MGHVWTAPWQELSDVAAALVGCGHVSGLRRAWPLALMLCVDRVPIKSTHLKCADPNGLSRSPERPFLHYVVMPSPIGIAVSHCHQQLRLPVPRNLRVMEHRFAT